MFLASFPAGPWQTNCYLLAPERGADLVVIDPGVQAAEQVIAFADAEGVGVAGVLLTHGHIDHVGTAADLADHYGVPAWLHADDRELLSDAGPILGPSLNVARELGVGLREPGDLRLIEGGEDLSVGGFEFHVHHAPGHRPGCVMFSVVSTSSTSGGGSTSEGVVSTSSTSGRGSTSGGVGSTSGGVGSTSGGVVSTGDQPQPTASTLLFSGDVLFAGSIGRTDLPGGDPDIMVRTLKHVVLDLPDDWAVLSGHGPETTIGHERATNPYLKPSFLR